MDFRGVKEFLKDTFGYLVIIVVVLLVCIYVVSLQQNIGPSMEPTLGNGDVLLLNKLSYKFGKIKRNDIVIFYYADTKYLVKRVIGLPGEKIDFKNNTLYINDQAYEETFLGEDVVTDDFSMNQIKGCEDGVIPEGTYFVLGDNRSNSMDSRALGVVKESDIIGKPIFRFYPLTKMGIVK